MALSPADCEFAAISILLLQRMAGSTRRTAATTAFVQRQLWAVLAVLTRSKRADAAVHEWRRRRDGFAPGTVRLKKTGRIVGWGGLCDDPFNPGWGIELAYCFDPTSWGNGYATELCHAALKFSDQSAEAEKVTDFTHSQNAASIALLTKLGFKYLRFVEDMERSLFSRERKASGRNKQ